MGVVRGDRTGSDPCGAPRGNAGVLLLGALVWLVVASAAGPARAQGPGDGLYGRFHGDLTLAVDAGAGVLLGDGGPRAGLVGELRARYLDAAGPFVAGRFSPDGPDALVFGVTIRPLFPSLFFENLWTGYGFVDRLVQSLGVDLGLAVTPLDSGTGVGFAVGFALEPPLWWSDRTGNTLALRLAARYLTAQPGDQAGPTGGLSAWMLWAGLAWSGHANIGLAAWEPPDYRPR